MYLGEDPGTQPRLMCLDVNKSGKVYWSGEQVFSKCILRAFAHRIGLDVHLLQTQICCHKANHTTNLMLYKLINYYS